MQLTNLTKQDSELVQKAQELIKKRISKRSTVAACLRTTSNQVFCGVNISIEGSEPCSICAEYAAIGTMVTAGEREIKTIVAVSGKHKNVILPPCGKCRQFICEFGNPDVIVQVDAEAKKAKLSELYPLPVVSGKE
jgi:cytidine deaminase